MSCLFQRHNGFFYVVTAGKGRRVWRSLHTRDEGEAKEAFREIMSEQQRKTSLSLRLFAEDFLGRASLSLSSKTVSMHRSALNNFIRTCGDRSVRKITPLHIETFKQQRVQDVSPVSVNIELRSLRAAFGEAQRLGLIGNNPFTAVRKLRVPFTEGKYLTEEGLSSLAATIQDGSFRDLVIFAVFTMMRIGEIVNLRWSDIDLERKEIHIRSNEKFRVKGGKPRTVPMSRWVYTFLRGCPVRREYLFQSRNGRQLTTRAVSRRFKKYVRSAGLDDGLHFHSLRHSGISWLMNKGVPPQFVQRIAGHSSLNVTRVYTHLEDKNLVSAVNAFGPFLMN